MKFNIRLLNESDYDNTLVKWWQDWRWQAPPKEMLPNNGLGGFMISKEDVNICAGFAYFTNSGIAFCEFIVSNFEYKDKDRHEAIELLIESCWPSRAIPTIRSIPEGESLTLRILAVAFD